MTMRAVVFLRTGQVQQLAATAPASSPPDGAVFVRCSATTTFEEILLHLIQAFGLMDERGAGVAPNTVTMIRAVRLFIERVPPGGSGPILVLEDAQHISRGVLDRLRFLAPLAPGAVPPLLPEVAPQAPSGLFADAETEAPVAPITRRVPVKTMALAAVCAAAVLGTSYYRLSRASKPTAMEQQADRAGGAAAVIAEQPLLHSPSFAIEVVAVDSRESAARIVRQLETQGVAAFADGADSPSPVRVLAGPYATRAEAEAALRGLSTRFRTATIAPLP
jgi:cell division septation protein DedD